jgi:hypothetical protein
MKAYLLKPKRLFSSNRQNFSQGSGGGRPKVEIPGLEEKVIELFDQGLSRNQVLKELNKIPGFENVTVGVVRRIKEEAGVGATKEELFKSQTDKYKKLKTLIENSNDNLVYTMMKDLRLEAGLPQNVAISDLKNYEKFNIPKLDTAPDKIKKAFDRIINNPNIPVEEVFDFSSTIAKQTGTTVQTVGKVLNTLPEYEDFKSTALKLQNPAFKARVAGKEKTLADVMEMSGNVGSSSGYVSMGNTPERFILNSITRHINQGGDKVEWVKAPSETVTETEAVFRYKGKDYDYYDLLQNGRKIDDFKEVYKSFDDLNDLLSREVINPITKQKTSFKELMTQAYKKGAGYGDNINPYEIDHFGSVKDSPFSNLRILPRRINAAAGSITSAAQRATTGVFTKKGKDWTPTKSKMYLQKSGYNFTKDIDKLFNDEVKLANDILVKNRKLRSVVEIGKEAADKKFEGLLNLEGVTTASKVDRPEAAIVSDMFKDLSNKIANIKDVPVTEVQEDVSKVTKLLNETAGKLNSGTDPVFLAKYLKAQGEDIAAFGKKYGGDALNKIIKGTTALDLPIFQVAFASMQDWEEDSPLWVTLPAAFTDYTAKTFNLYEKTGGKTKEFGKFLASSLVPRFMRSPIFKAVTKFGKGASLAAPLLEIGLGVRKDLKQRAMLPEIARQFNIPIEEAKKGYMNYVRDTVPQDAFDELNVPESPGLEGLKRGFQDFMSIFGFTESPYKDPNAKQPIEVETPKVDNRDFLFAGGVASLFKRAAQVSEALRRVKNATFEMWNNVRMFGEQKGVAKNLEGFTNIPDKNRKTSSIEDLKALKESVPEKYHQDLNIMMRSIEQNNFETAWKEYKKFEKELDPTLKFENIPQEYFPMLDPLNDAFVIKGPRDDFKIGRYKIRTSMQLDETGKPTGKYQSEKYDTFDPETRTFRDEPVLVGASTDKGKKGLN